MILQRPTLSSSISTITVTPSKRTKHKNIYFLTLQANADVKPLVSLSSSIAYKAVPMNPISIADIITQFRQ